jgi:hypothetical protein
MSKFEFFQKIFKKKNEEKNNNEVKLTKEKSEENVILTHSEILYSSDDIKKDEKITKPLIQEVSEDIKWRDIEGIEKKIDNLTNNKLKDLSINTGLNKKVDNIISQKKKHRKPANVIYVVSKPQPGQVKGDWAVRSHGKIFSHHRTKENAIKKAREVALKKSATVLIQNTDGTFSDGFKPRTKSK